MDCVCAAAGAHRRVARHSTGSHDRAGSLRAEARRIHTRPARLNRRSPARVCGDGAECGRIRGPVAGVGAHHKKCGYRQTSEAGQVTATKGLPSTPKPTVGLSGNPADGIRHARRHTTCQPMCPCTCGLVHHAFRKIVTGAGTLICPKRRFD